MSCNLLLAVSLCLLVTIHAEIVRYDRYGLIQVEAKSQKQLEYLANLHDTTELDFWTHPSLIRPTDILLAPGEFDKYVKDLSQQGFNVTVLHNDIQRLLEDLGQHPHAKRQVQLSFLQATEGFPTYKQIYQWILNKIQANSNIMSVSSIGKTYEGRETYLVKLGVPGVNKPAIWIDSGIHAREWLAVSTGINLIDTMLNAYNARDTQVRSLLTKFDWYFLPVANPDGYEYTHTTGGRMWRKTRTPYGSSYGADPNRNFAYQWCTTGVSRSSSSDQYCGPRAWSEKCVANMKQSLEQLQSRLKMYMTMHSYGQMWFIPYAWSKTAFPTDYSKLYQVSQNAVSEMYRKYGSAYSLGRVPDLLYEASGSSMDWVKGVLRTPYTFGMELRPGRDVPYGFISTVTQIKPSAREVWTGIKSVAVTLSKEF